MSYVLDALRRAEADRQRGQVPHLHAPAAVGAAAAPVAVAQRPGRVRWAVLALLLVVVSLGAWWWAGGPEPAPQSVAPASPDPAPAVASRAPAPTAPRAAPVPPPVALPAPAPARSATARPAPPAAQTAPPPARPPMAFGGAFDSPDPKARMLIINGQVWREGDEPVPGWVLERIGLHAARFAVQGRSVDITYAGGPAR